MITTDDPDVLRLSAAPWPAYVRVRMEPDLRQILFMFPRKCASNTIKQVLEKVSTFDTKHWLTAQDVRQLDSNIPRVAVVREPLERLKSGWRHAVVKHEAEFLKMEASGIQKGTSWEDFVVAICATPDAYTNYHMKSQTLELIDMVGGRMPNEIIHVENLNEEWDELCTRYGWTWRPLGHLNPSDSNLETPVTKRLESLVCCRYVRDYMNFYPRKKKRGT